MVFSYWELGEDFGVWSWGLILYWIVSEMYRRVVGGVDCELSPDVVSTCRYLLVLGL